MVTCLLRCSNGWNVFTSQKIIVCPYHSDILPISWVESGADTVFTRMSYYIYVQGRHHFKDSMKFIGISWRNSLESVGLISMFFQRFHPEVCTTSSASASAPAGHWHPTCRTPTARPAELVPLRCICCRMCGMPSDLANMTAGNGSWWDIFINIYIYILFVHEKCDII